MAVKIPYIVGENNTTDMVEGDPDDRSLARMGGLNRQRNAMLASRETIQGQLIAQLELVAKISNELSEIPSDSPDHPIKEMRVNQARRRLAEIVTDLDDLESRIEQYQEQMLSMVSIRETGEIVNKEELDG